ncbi:hypothetical protein [Pontibacter sp. G13]|uniref:hypothetical protein n=1 Tax=Pontibacter sp. G13 TaxID=3074898 RepID=UPI00288962FE|nr:hypothetical protein [Pontibacter sp. G13]WNJ21087.1 hypothetical protein RJD25_11510 [Pontibacter sp. G13]
MKRTVFTLVLTCALGMGTLMAQSGVRQTQRSQANRITQGIATGELTRREACQLTKQQKRIQKTKRAAKADGVVTPGERAVLNRQQQQASRAIYRQKHDGQNRP